MLRTRLSVHGSKEIVPLNTISKERHILTCYHNTFSPFVYYRVAVVVCFVVVGHAEERIARLDNPTTQCGFLDEQ